MNSTKPPVRSRRGDRPVLGAALGLRARIVLGFSVLVLLFAVVLLTVLVQVQRIREGLAVLSSGYLPLAQEIAGMKSLPLGTEQDAAGASDRLLRAQRVEKALIGRMREQLGRARATAETAAEQASRAEDRSTLRGIGSQLALASDILDQYENAWKEAVAAAEVQGDSAAPALAPLFDLRRQLDLNLRILSKRLARRTADVVERTEVAQRDAVVAVVLLSSIAFAAATALLLGTHMALLPIRRLTAVAEQVREGRFEQRVPVPGDDELGRLASAMNAMAASLEERERRLGERSTELEAALADLRDSQDRLVRSERLAAIGTLAAQIAHEVRNPLNALGLNAELLGDAIEAGDRQEATELLAAIRGEAHRLAEITEAYLAVGRLPKLRIEAQPLPPLLAELLRFQQQEFQQASVRATLDADPDLPDVPVDAAQLRQALLNIVRNAKDAMPGGGVIAMRVARDEDFVRIDVADDGPGMPAETVSRIFDPFFSTKSGGSGLGLPITQQIVTEHGGRIACISAPGSGTTFSLWLPIAREPRA